MTTMKSVSLTEEIRWAMISLVESFSFSRKVRRISVSVAVSTAEVESSRMTIFGFFRSVRAMQSRWR